MFIGMDDSGGSGLFGGGTAYMAWVGTPNATALGFATSNTERMRITASGNVGIGINPRAKLDVEGSIITGWQNARIGTQFSTDTSGYYLGMITNVSNRELYLDAQSSDPGGSGGIILRTGSGPTERMRINASGNVSIPANLSVGTISAVNTAITTYNNTDNRLLFRDGAGALTVGACTFWNYTNNSIAWTYGTSINNAFYVPSTTATIQIQITGSGYSTFVGNTTFRVIAYDAVNAGYTSTVIFFFNQGSVHTQVTQHITIPNNAWGGNTIGYKRLFVDWYSGGTYVASDSNDSLNFSISVIG
jgi:hypothetical protein